VRYSDFWATVTSNDALCYWADVLSCLSVCNVGVLWPNGWMDQDTTWYGSRPIGLGPGDIVLDSSLVRHFSTSSHAAHVYCGETVAHLSYTAELLLFQRKRSDLLRFRLIVLDNCRNIVGSKVQRRILVAAACIRKFNSILGLTIGDLERDTPVKNPGYANGNFT